MKTNNCQKCRAHPCVEACLAPIVALVIGPLIELLPQRLGLPGSQLGLELRVELVEVGRLDLEEVAEVPEVAEYGLEGGGVAELIEDLAGQGHLRRRHQLPAARRLLQVQVIHPVCVCVCPAGASLLRVPRSTWLQAVSLPAIRGNELVVSFKFGFGGWIQ